MLKASGCPPERSAGRQWSSANRRDSLLAVTFDLLCLLGILISLRLR
jgi:hypothetical protein